MSPSALSDLVSEVPLVAKNPLGKQDKEEAHVHGMVGMNPLQAMAHGDVVMPGIPKFDTFEETRQWQLEHMAAAFRHWAREDYIEGIAGHISVRDPEHHDAFWTNPLGIHFGLLKASDMILLNFDGKVIGGNRSRPANSAGFLIHAAVHKARPDVHSVCHAHTIYGKAWSVFAKPLEMLTQDCCKFYNAHAVYDSYGGIVLAAEEGNRIAKALGTGKAAFLMNHGLLSVGGTVDEAAFLFTSLERACKVQLIADAAAANGLKKHIISDEEAQYNFDMESNYETCYMEFQAYYQLEEARDPSFKN